MTMIGTPFDLTGRVALITGGSKGLGRAMATIFAQAGATLVISSRHAEELQAAAAEIGRSTGARVEPVVADMTRREDVLRLSETPSAPWERSISWSTMPGPTCRSRSTRFATTIWDRLVELNLTSSWP